MIRVALGMMLVVLARAAEPMVVEGRAMGTNWSVKIATSAAPLARGAVARRVAARLEQIEQAFSTYRADSDLSRFNASATLDWFPVTPEVAQVALAARELSALTQGAFDPTVEPLVRLWGFGAQRRVGDLPTADEIAAARARVGWTDLLAQPAPPALRRQRPGITADYSSIAKGFATDEIARLLVSLGASDFFVGVAGDVKAVGHAATGERWRVGIEEPHEDGHGLSCVVHLADEALSTSGDYRNCFFVAGRRYGHIMDPRTGAPAMTGLASVSVAVPSCARSSALATALFVLGPDAGFALARREHLACLFIIRTEAGLKYRPTPEWQRLEPTDGVLRR